jgi:hypothetical protein
MMPLHIERMKMHDPIMFERNKDGQKGVLRMSGGRMNLMRMPG